MATAPVIPDSVIATINAQALTLRQLKATRDGLITRINAASDSVDAYYVSAQAAVTAAPAPAPSATDPLMQNAVFVNGALDASAYALTASQMGTEPGAAYLFGPAASYYGVPDSDLPMLYRNADQSLDVIAAGYGNNDATYGRNKLRGCALGKCGTWQIGGPPLPGQGGMYSSSMGQGLFIPDNRQAVPFGIGMTDFCSFSVSENIVSTKPEPYFGYYGGGLDTVNQVSYKAQGKDVSYPVAMARGEGRPGWGIGTISVTRNGFVSTNGQNTGSNIASLQLDANKRPTAITVTNCHEFALITVWDTVALKGQIAVIALAGTPQNGYLGNEANWETYRGEWRGVYPGLPNYGNIGFMKLVGYVDLPGMPTPSAISATTAWSAGKYSVFQGYDGQNGFNLSNAAHRTALRSGDRSGYTPDRCLVAVVSKEQKLGLLFDFGSLLRNYRDLYYGTSEPPSVATGTFPPTFTQAPSQLPTLVKTINFTDRPTAVKCAMEQKRMFVALQGGNVELWDLGDYPAASTGNPATIVRKSSTFVGRNITCLALTKRHAGSAGRVAGKNYFGEEIFAGAAFNDYIWAVCRGDRKIVILKMSSDMASASVFRTLRDKRMVDPISVEDNDNHTTETYICTVADFTGKQFVNYRYGPAIFWDHQGVMSDNPDNPLTYDWTACLPPGGQPVTTVTFNGVVQPFECGGTYPIAGKPVFTSTSNVF